MEQVARFSDFTKNAVVFTNAQSTTGGFVMAVHSGALLRISETSSGGAITLQFGARPSKESAEYYIVCDSANTPLTLTVEPGRCYALPEELFATRYATATTSAAGATVTCYIDLKG